MFCSEHQREMRETLATDPDPVLPRTSDDISLTSVFPMPAGPDQTVTPSTELALLLGNLECHLSMPTTHDDHIFSYQRPHARRITFYDNQIALEIEMKIVKMNCDKILEVIKGVCS